MSEAELSEPAMRLRDTGLCQTAAPKPLGSELLTDPASHAHTHTHILSCHTCPHSPLKVQIRFKNSLITERRTDVYLTSIPGKARCGFCFLRAAGRWLFMCSKEGPACGEPGTGQTARLPQA